MAKQQAGKSGSPIMPKQQSHASSRATPAMPSQTSYKKIPKALLSHSQLSLLLPASSPQQSFSLLTLNSPPSSLLPLLQQLSHILQSEAFPLSLHMAGKLSSIHCTTLLTFSESTSGQSNTAAEIHQLRPTVLLCQKVRGGSSHSHKGGSHSTTPFPALPLSQSHSYADHLSCLSHSHWSTCLTLTAARLQHLNSQPLHLLGSHLVLPLPPP